MSWMVLHHCNTPSSGGVGGSPKKHLRWKLILVIGTKELSDVFISFVDGFLSNTSNDTEAMKLKKGDCLRTSTGRGSVLSVEEVLVGDGDVTVSIVLKDAALVAEAGVSLTQKSPPATPSRSSTTMPTSSLPKLTSSPRPSTSPGRIRRPYVLSGSRLPGTLPKKNEASRARSRASHETKTPLHNGQKAA